MRGRLFTCGGKGYDLPPLLRWEILRTGSVPCDSFSVTFPYDAAMAEALRTASEFQALDGAGATVLRAIVDEYQIELGVSGLTAQVNGRGFAARLLDNESRPMTYQQVTLEELIRGHVTPYGIRTDAAADLRSTIPYTVAAGTSEWKVLEGFCRTRGGFTPGFTAEGRLLAVPEGEGGRRLRLEAGTAVLSCVVREDRYGVFSEVLVIDKTRNVSYTVENPEAKQLYTPGQSTWDAMRYTGEYQIRRSREEEKTVTLRLAGNFPAQPGDTVEAELPMMGIKGVYRAAEVRSMFSPNQGETSVLILKERG